MKYSVDTIYKYIRAIIIFYDRWLLFSMAKHTITSIVLAEGLVLLQCLIETQALLSF